MTTVTLLLVTVGSREVITCRQCLLYHMLECGRIRFSIPHGQQRVRLIIAASVRLEWIRRQYVGLELRKIRRFRHFQSVRGRLVIGCNPQDLHLVVRILLWISHIVFCKLLALPLMRFTTCRPCSECRRFRRGKVPCERSARFHECRDLGCR